MTIGFPVTQAGTTGLDYSANKPTLPNIGVSPWPTAAGNPYSGYFLVATAPASPGRNCLEVWNPSGAQIVVVRDDGTAANNAAPNNASAFPLGGGSATGAQGGYRSWPQPPYFRCSVTQRLPQAILRCCKTR
jgi:hypothetical protein